MDSHSILNNDGREVALPAEALQPVEPPREWPGTENPAARNEVRFPGEDAGKSLAGMAKRDLNATLQLLAERAQYITGATGAAIALRDSEEMVCRASAGTSAPEVGAQLQVNSGLSGESIRTRQTLRCHDAYTDERVNRESCEALGIRSVVVMPLLRGAEVLGVFELFSDKANVFEARDITALERMGTMVQSVLEQSGARQGFAFPKETPEPASGAQVGDNGENQAVQELVAGADLQPIEESASEPISISESANASAVAPTQQPAAATDSTVSRGIVFHMKMPGGAAASTVKESCEASPIPVNVSGANGEPDILEAPPETEIASVPNHQSAGPIQEEDILCDERGSIVPATSAPVPGPVLEVAISESPTAEAAEAPAPPPAPVKASQGAVAKLRKCEACGFPVSEGRQLCLDCEKKKGGEATSAAKTGAASTSIRSTSTPSTPTPNTPTPNRSTPSVTAPSAAHDSKSVATADVMPQFLAGESEERSWLAAHKFLLVTIALAILAIVGAFLIR